MSNKAQIRVLLVEDDVESGEALKMMLERRDVTVTLVESADAAFRVFTPDSFDAVVSDIRLDGQSGVDILRRIREMSAEFPVILLTGFDSIESAVQAVRLGAQDYILKPLDSIEDLFIPIKTAVRNHRLFLQNRLLQEELGRNEKRFRDLAESLSSSGEQLRALSVRMESVREEERIRIARKIHDELGQALTALKMDLAWIARRLPEDNKELRDKASSMMTLSDSMIGVVQQVATELRPAILDDLGIAAAIDWQAAELEKHSGINCSLDLGGLDEILEADLTTSIFRIVQEALTNIVRHAKADEVAIVLERSDATLKLTIRDDGVGIDDTHVTSSRSLGLIGMKERALAVGGEVKFTGSVDGGTTVTLSVPLCTSGGRM